MKRQNGLNFGKIIKYILIAHVVGAICFMALLYAAVTIDENKKQQQIEAELATAPTVDPTPLPYQEGLDEGQVVYIDAKSFELESGHYTQSGVSINPFDSYTVLVTTASGEKVKVIIDADFYQEHIDENAPKYPFEIQIYGDLVDAEETLDSSLRLYGKVNSAGLMYCNRLSPPVSSAK